MSVREGYKQTEIGVIPEDWEVVRLGDVLKLKGGNAFKSEDFIDSGIPVLKISNINKNGQIDLSNCVYVNEQNIYAPYLLSHNDIVVAMSGATTGKMGQVKAENLPLYLNQRVGKFEIIKKNQLNNDYLYFNVTRNEFLDRLLVNAIGGAQPNISSKQIEELQIPLPPLHEQQKIAEILSTVDQKIDSIDSKIEETQTLKRGLMQRLLSEGIRHSEFKESEIGRIPARWEVVELGDVCEKRKIKNVEMKYSNVLTNSAVLGIISQEEYFDREITTEKNLVNYFIVELNDYVYNPRISATAPCGPINQLKKYESGIVSPLYTVFRKKTSLLHDPFLECYLISNQWNEFVKNNSNTGARHDRMSISDKTFFSMPIPLPPLPEQRQIADILSTTDEKLETLRAKKEAFETLKKGLMQKLLSGEVRVQ